MAVPFYNAPIKVQNLSKDKEGDLLALDLDQKNYQCHSIHPKRRPSWFFFLLQVPSLMFAATLNQPSIRSHHIVPV